MARLGDVCSIYAGTGFPIQYQGNSEGQYPFYKVGDISRNATAGNKILSLCDNYIDFDVVKAIKGTVIPAGTVVFAKIGEAIKLNRRAITNCECLIDNNAMGIRPHVQHVLLDYFFHFICNVRMETLAEATTVPSIKKSIIEKIEIPVPTLKEQQRIATELNHVDNLLSLRKQQLAKLDELVKSRFVEMFGDPFNNKKWNTQKLRNISVSISDGSNVDKTYYKDKGDVLFLRIQNVWFNEFRLDDSVYISEDVNNEYLDTSLHHGDLLITKIGRYYTKDSSLGRVSVYLGEDDKANYSNNIMRVRLTDEVCSEFVNILMNLDDYNRYIREVSVGGTDKRALSKAIIGDLPIIMPPKELQFEFLEFVRQTDKSKLAVQQSIDQLETLKKSLMQKYFG